MQYLPLDVSKAEIRLLRVLPRKPQPHEGQAGSADLECDIIHAFLGSCLPYLALSYSWGDPNEQSRLVVGGKDCQTSSTVEEALRQIQAISGNAEFLIWVDQICIKQDDTVEKTHQVRMMNRIYREAAKCMVWLGPADNDIKFLFGDLKQFHSDIVAENYTELFRRYSRNDFEEVKKLEKAFHAFCSRRYWTRLWVIQEFAVASEVVLVCGNLNMPYVPLGTVLAWMQRLGPDNIPKVNGIDLPTTLRVMIALGRALKGCQAASFMQGIATRRQRYQTSRRTDTKYDDNLFRVLATTLALEYDYNSPETSDPRDRVFSILELADDASEFVGLLDYDPTVTCEVIYRQTAKIILQQGRVDYLAYCDLRGQTSVPSWVPDWQMQIRRPYFKMQWSDTNKFKAASQADAKVDLLYDDPRLVQLRGTAVDTITAVSAVWEPDWLYPLDKGDALRYLHDVKQLCEKSPRIGIDSKELEAARIAVADSRWGSTASEHGEFNQGYLKARTHLIAAEQSGPPHVPLDDPMGYSLPWYLMEMRFLRSCRPFISQTGYVGLAPPHAEPGDQICVLYGGISPYIIRSSGQDPQRPKHQLIGAAFVHGIMYGEVMEQDHDSRTFTLE